MTDVYVFGAMLLYKSGKEINEKNLNDVLDAAGIEAQACRVQNIIGALHGINIDDAIKAGVFATPVQTVTEQKVDSMKVEIHEEKPKEADGLSVFKNLFGDPEQ